MRVGGFERACSEGAAAIREEVRGRQERAQRPQVAAPDGRPTAFVKEFQDTGLILTGLGTEERNETGGDGELCGRRVEGEGGEGACCLLLDLPGREYDQGPGMVRV